MNRQPTRTSRIGEFLRANVAEALLLTGGASISCGVGMVYLPAGFIVGGALLLVAGYLLAKAG